jgi:hypothetical protein
MRLSEGWRAAARPGIKHPPGQIERTGAVVGATPKEGHTSTSHLRDDRYLASALRMPAIEDLSLLGNVGVLLWGCTTASGPMTASGGCPHLMFLPRHSSTGASPIELSA